MRESASSEPTLAARQGSVLWLTLNRPDRLNAVNLELYVALTDAVNAADGDDGVRAIVLTGAGRAFCAGADLKAHAEHPPTPRARSAYARAAQMANRSLQQCGKPVIAAVNGHAIGAGLELALSCDLIVVADDAKLRFPELALGTFYGGGVAHTLPARVGLGRAKELLFCGDFFTGREAQVWGVADRAVPAPAVAETAGTLALQLGERAPLPMRLAKRLLHHAPRMSRGAVMRAELQALVRCMSSADWSEGIAAHREKRAPRFTGE